MSEAIDPAIIKQAKNPHEIFMINLALFHLLAAPLVIALDVGLWGMLIPLALSSCVIAYIWFRAYKKPSSHELVKQHWIKAAKNTRILMAGYVVCIAILLIASVVAANSQMGGIMIVALSRVAIVPVILVMLICFVLESTALAKAGKGEV